MAAAATAATPALTAGDRLRRIGDEAAYLLLGLVAAAVALVFLVADLAAALGFGWLIVVGIPVLLACLDSFQWLAGFERRRAALVLGAPIAAAYRRADGDAGARLKAAARDPQRWRDLLYLTLLIPVGAGKGAIALTLWAGAIGTALAPAWWWSLPAGIEYGIFTIDTWRLAFLAVPVGVAMFPVVILVQRAMAWSEASMARALLGPSLVERVERLTETRAGAVDAAAAELHRIERDLHDGAQARLVALAMGLGMAEDRFERDPGAARELVGEAREEARRALAELRDLARGIRPSLLAERGLEPAITALAARSPIPARASVELARRPPDAVESAAWFVVSEALANAGKHSGARRVTIAVTGGEDALRVEVRDDGRGGADPAGGGLQGLRQRVAALDGSLEVSSPPGGPTAVRAVLPCGS